MMIPKIIHHTSPADKNKWHPIWNECYSSWKKHFPDNKYQYYMWNDDDIDNLIKNSFSKYRDLYFSFPFHINKIDFSRFCILYEYGGIYVDMDMYCYKNFYEELTSDAFIVQSPCDKEIVQNSLMGCVKKHDFFKMCIDLCDHKSSSSLDRTQYTLQVTGPKYLSRVLLLYNKKIQILPKQYYNSLNIFYDKEHRTKHMQTGIWGKEDIEYISKLRKYFNYDYDKIYKIIYFSHRNINLDYYSFYNDYLFIEDK